MFSDIGNHDVDELLHLIVDRCPNLEKLFLNFKPWHNPMNLDEIWKRGNWKHLHHLYLGYFMPPMALNTEAGNLFKHFMARHPGIECLEYPGPDNITHLSHLLKTNNIRALNLLKIPGGVDAPPSLNSQIAPALQVSMFDKVECLCIGSSFTGKFLEKTYGPSLRILIIESYVSNYEGGLVHYFPDALERLCIRCHIHVNASATSSLIH
ncbi:MAG TPA: hypothetical protein VGO47_06870 [Chlamydiales bacterium]|jgi:hypothetical protein|nr:hypothetical protein [Chlamydiales bacterium]